MFFLIYFFVNLVFFYLFIVEIQEKMNERLKQYENELKKKKKLNQLEDSI